MFSLSLSLSSGYSSVYSIGSSSQQFTNATFWLSGLRCHGNESSLFQCPHDWGSVNCSLHGNYATVFCSHDNPSSLPIVTKLINGTSNSKGVVRVRYYGIWGHVCSSQWTIRDANVVCRGLGYTRARGLKILEVAYSDSDPIWMDNIQCIGNEDHLWNCSFDGWGHHTHPSTCKSMFITCQNKNYDLRLYGRHGNRGILEVYYNRVWGFVCNSDWSTSNSHVACKQLGFETAESTYIVATPPVKGLVLMDGVKCVGSETRLVDCSFRGWGYAHTRCNGTNYVGVVCSNQGDDGISIRLVGNSTEYEGLVQVQYSGRWGFVCPNYWGDFEAKVK